MKRNLALLVILVLAYFGYRVGFNIGQMTVGMIVIGAFLWGLLFLHKKYGTKKIVRTTFNELLAVYNPALPPITEDEALENDVAYNSQGGMLARLPQTHIQEIPELTSHFDTYTPLGLGTGTSVSRLETFVAKQLVAHPYEMQLGPDACVDIEQAFLHALLVDPEKKVLLVLAEEISAKQVPLLFIDCHGTYATLVQEFPRGRRVCSAASQKSRSAADIPLEKDQEQEAQLLGHTMQHEGLQLVFDVSSYASSTDAMVVLWDIIAGMTAWKQDQLIQAGHILPSIIFVSDANSFCPNNNDLSLVKENTNTVQQMRRDLVHSLQNDIGLYWYFATRGVAGLNIDVLHFCEVWFVNQPLITEVRGGWITSYIGIPPKTLETLETQHTIIFEIASRQSQTVALRAPRTKFDMPFVNTQARRFSRSNVRTATEEIPVVHPFQNR